VHKTLALVGFSPHLVNAFTRGVTVRVGVSVRVRERVALRVWVRVRASDSVYVVQKPRRPQNIGLQKLANLELRKPTVQFLG